MKTILKTTIKRILYSLKQIYYLIPWLYFFLKNFKYNEKIMECNRKILIIANGPSVEKLNFFEEKYADYDFLCVNHFATQNPNFLKIKPRYYCIIHDGFYRKSNLEDEQLDKIISVFEKVDWKMTIILLAGQAIKLGNKNIDFIHLNSNIYSGSFMKDKLFSHNLASIKYQNVVNAAIYYSITAKAKEVCLVGVENDWHREVFVNSDNDVIRERLHFYGKSTVILSQNGTIQKGELYKYFYWYYITLLQYYELGRYAKNMNVPIFNLTSNSYIDVFDRKEI